MRFCSATLSLSFGAFLAPHLRTSTGFTLTRPISLSKTVEVVKNNNHHYGGVARVGKKSNIRLFSSNSNSEEDLEKVKKMMAEGAMMNPEMMKQSAEEMKNMKPEDMDRIIGEMDQMGEGQKEQLKSLGMDVEMMKKSMTMMRQNPELIRNAQQMMEKLTPEQMVAQSKIAQKQMQSMTPEQVDQAAKALSSIPADQLDQASQTILDTLQQQESSSSSTPTDSSIAGTAQDPKVVDAMFQVAQVMSEPPTGGVVFEAFASLPPITILTGSREEDLSPDELAECWADGSLGATRLDRAGFERVWDEVRGWFEDDIMKESRKSIHKKTTTAQSTVSTSSATASTIADPVVGANLSEDQLSAVNDRVKNMSGSDMNDMLSQMQNMTPEQEARMKEMGVDPSMMKKVSGMMENNPLMKNAAQAMMKNMSPEQMMKSSQQAQDQMKNMSSEQMDEALEKLGQNPNNDQK